MLTVVIPTLNSEKPLAHTLAFLVPAVVEGLLRRVVVVDGGSGDDTRLVAEGAGCTLYRSAEIMVALREIRTPWVLLLCPGATLEPGWEEPVRDYIREHTGAARFSRPEDQGLLKKLFGSVATLDAGLLVRLDALHPFIEAGVSFDALPSKLKPVVLPVALLG
ncbi:glycosyltransferase family 2 protein [Brucella sp. BE17]|uniref:glycosyltransferase family 2 protein n=1 Tax=Brucella sp. BE17 TaxID=3142977 RepID=UPI0031BB80C0